MRLGPPVFHPGSLPQSNCPLPPKERSDAELSETAPDLTALGLCRNRRGYRHNRATNHNSLRGIRAQSQRERKSACDSKSILFDCEMAMAQLATALPDSGFCLRAARSSADGGNHGSTVSFTKYTDCEAFQLSSKTTRLHLHWLQNLGFGRRRDNQKDCRRINRSCEKASRILVQVCEVAYWHKCEVPTASNNVRVREAVSTGRRNTLS